MLIFAQRSAKCSALEAFNEVTFKGFERGRTLHLLRPGNQRDTPAQCFLLSADQENPNECMMGIRMQVWLWDGVGCLERHWDALEMVLYVE